MHAEALGKHPSFMCSEYTIYGCIQYINVYGCFVCIHACTLRGQKRALNPLGLELQTVVDLPISARELNLGSLGAEPTLLTAGSSLQPLPRLLRER